MTRLVLHMKIMQLAFHIHINNQILLLVILNSTKKLYCTIRNYGFLSAQTTSLLNCYTLLLAVLYIRVIWIKILLT